MMFALVMTCSWHYSSGCHAFVLFLNCWLWLVVWSC